MSKKSRSLHNIGNAGELHQTGGAVLTTNHGVAVSDNQNSLRAGPGGPSLLEDFVLREKYSILITNAFPNELSTRVVRVRMNIWK